MSWMAVVVGHRPSHPSNAGTEHVGFSPTRQTLLPPSAKRREVCASRMKGELHPAKNLACEPDFLALDDSVEEIDIRS